jgi:hypothetical protein
MEPREDAMNNSSMFTADRTTHLKIVVVALIAAILVAGIGVTARVADYGNGTTGMQASGPALKAGQPVTAATRDGITIR